MNGIFPLIVLGLAAGGQATVTSRVGEVDHARDVVMRGALADTLASR